MSRVALVEPANLLGQGVRDVLGADPGRYDVQLLDSSAEAEGTLTQIGSEVAVVHSLSREALQDADVVILCGNAEQQQAALEMSPKGTPAVLCSTAVGDPTGQVAVAGITALSGLDAGVLVSPHPGVVVLSHILSPLLEFRPRRVTATVLVPTSLHNEPGLDELFEQTRGILNFQGEMPTAVFPAQLAFNLLPIEGGATLGTQIGAVLGTDLSISTQLVQAPVFHGLAASLHVEFEAATEAAALREALGTSAYLDIAENPDVLGPIDSAAREEILVGRIGAAAGSAGEFEIWAVMDNLTRGGANNAVEIAAQLLTHGD